PQRGIRQVKGIPYHRSHELNFIAFPRAKQMGAVDQFRGGGRRERPQE
ncbi:hypothetical protein A2U01_0061468, partial [Trifolium medium]|nr:hypothetical protein [Trifolium medium]